MFVSPIPGSWHISTCTKLVSLQSESQGSLLVTPCMYLASTEILRVQKKHTVCPERASVFWDKANSCSWWGSLPGCSSFSIVCQHVQWAEPVRLLKRRHAWLIQQKAQLFVGRCLFWVPYFLFGCQNIFTCHFFSFFGLASRRIVDTRQQMVGGGWEDGFAMSPGPSEIPLATSLQSPPSLFSIAKLYGAWKSPQRVSLLPRGSAGCWSTV